MLASGRAGLKRVAQSKWREEARARKPGQRPMWRRWGRRLLEPLVEPLGPPRAARASPRPAVRHLYGVCDDKSKFRLMTRTGREAVQARGDHRQDGWQLRRTNEGKHEEREDGHGFIKKRPFVCTATPCPRTSSWTRHSRSSPRTASSASARRSRWRWRAVSAPSPSRQTHVPAAQLTK